MSSPGRPERRCPPRAPAQSFPVVHVRVMRCGVCGLRFRVSFFVLWVSVSGLRIQGLGLACCVDGARANRFLLFADGTADGRCCGAEEGS